MSQLHRFYVPDLAQQPETVRLSDDERHHALHVVRLCAGQKIRLFDGAGRWCDAEVVSVAKRGVEIQRNAVQTDAPRENLLTLGQAWLNHERSIETIVQRGTELGVNRFVFFRARHSERAARGDAKWRRWAIESCKQCGRNQLPDFAVADDLVSAMAGALEARYVIATQHAAPVPLGSAVGGGPIVLLVGPEGDFTADEIEEVLQRGGQAISLGPFTLRSEVAAIAAVTLVQHALGRLGV